MVTFIRWERAIVQLQLAVVPRPELPEPDDGATVCVVVLLLAEPLLCPADCLQAEWAQRKSRSLATCEHSPPLS